MLVLALLVLCAPSAQVQKLNGTLPPDPGLGGGDVGAFALDPTAQWFVYLANQEEVEFARLWVGRVDGSVTPYPVTPPLPARVFEGRPRFSPDGLWITYLAEDADPDAAELFAVPRDGSAAPHKLNGALVENGELADGSTFAPYEIGADSARVVYCAAQEQPNRFELWSVPLDGSAPAVRLSSSLRGVTSYRLTPDSAHVLFLSDVAIENVFELMLAPVDGSTAATRVLPPLDPTRTLQGYHPSADGAAVLVLADLDVDETYTLYRAPLDGSAPPVALTLPVAGRDVTEFRVASSGRVVFAGDLRADGGFEVFSAPDDFSAPHVRLSGAIVAGGDAGGIHIEPDGLHALYVADARVNDRLELFRVPVAGGAAPVRVSGPLGPFGDVLAGSIQFTPDGSHVAYFADDVRGGRHLYASRLAQPSARHLCGEFVPRGDVRSFVLSDTHVLFCADAELDGRFDLFVAPLGAWPPPVRASDGGPARERGPVRLSTPLGSRANTEPNSYALTADGLALWFGAHATPDRYELFARPADLSAAERRLSGALTDGPPSGLILRYASDGEQVFYVGTQLEPQRGELFRVRIEEAPAFAALVELDLGHVSAVQLAPDGAHLLYLADATIEGSRELFRVARDGSAPAVCLSGPVPPASTEVLEDLRFTPDGARVVFQCSGVGRGLFSGPLDGSLPPVTLHAAAVGQLELTADGTYALFRSDLAQGGRFELFQVRIDGSAPAISLFPALGAGSVDSLALAPDGAFAVFTADAVVDGQFDLYRVPCDGSAAPVRLFTPSPGFVVHASPWISPDSTRVVYGAHLPPFGVTELYSVLADGSSAPQLLHPAHPFGAGIRLWLPSPDGVHVIYAEEGPSGGPALFLTKIDGSSAPTQLTPREPGSNARFEGLVASPDGSELVYEVDSPLLTLDELRLVALDGGHAPLVLRTLPSNGGVVTCRFSDDSQRLFVLAQTQGSTSQELSVAPSDGSQPLQVLNAPLVPGGDVRDFELVPGGSAVIYRADQELLGVPELYLAPLP